MTSSIERRPAVHPAERWNSPHRFVPSPRTEVLSFGEAAPAAPARLVAPEVIEREPLERQRRTRTLTARVLSVWRRLQPSTWGLLALVTLNLILIPFAIAKGG